MSDTQKCSRCKCIKLLTLFNIRSNTNKIYKTCIQCCERFVCDRDDCKKKFSLDSTLQRHIKAVHDKIKDCVCDRVGCEYKCSLDSALQMHIKAVHDKIKDCVCDRDDCKQKFSSDSNLQQHIKQVHDKIKDFVCDRDDCKYKCSFDCDLQKHIKAVHDKIKDCVCDRDDCKKKFSLDSTLQRHIKAVHDNIKDFKCDRDGCTSKFSSKYDLQKHIKYNCTGKSTISGLEFRVNNILIKLGFNEGKDYIHNSIYSKLTDYCGKKLRPDFRFHDYKIMIEADGIQHYKPTSFSGYNDAEENFKVVQEHDNIKNEFCKKFNYKMIRIRYDEKDIEKQLREELKDIIKA